MRLRIPSWPNLFRYLRFRLPLKKVNTSFKKCLADMGTGITDVIGGPHDFLPPSSDRSDEFKKLWVSMEDQYCRRQGRILKTGNGTSEEGFKLTFLGTRKNGNILVQERIKCLTCFIHIVSDVSCSKDFLRHLCLQPYAN